MFSRFWSSVSLLALGVGASTYFLWKYNKDKKQLEEQSELRKKNTFTIHRVIDGNCVGKVLSIGVNGFENLNFQGIRLGDEDTIHKLVTFTKSENQYKYEFENNVTFTVYLTEKKELLYSLEMDNVLVKMKDIDNKVRESWKTISMASTELDELLQL
jgi:hypothetical protein